MGGGRKHLREWTALTLARDDREPRVQSQQTEDKDRGSFKMKRGYSIRKSRDRSQGGSKKRGSGLGKEQHRSPPNLWDFHVYRNRAAERKDLVLRGKRPRKRGSIMFLEKEKISLESKISLTVTRTSPTNHQPQGTRSKWVGWMERLREKVLNREKKIGIRSP